MRTIGSAIGEQLLAEALVYPVVLDGINSMEERHPKVLANRQHHLLSDPDSEVAMTLFEQTLGLLIAPFTGEPPLDVYNALNILSPFPGFRSGMITIVTNTVPATAFLLEYMTVENNYFLSFTAETADGPLKLNGAPFVPAEWTYEPKEIDVLRDAWYNRPK